MGIFHMAGQIDDHSFAKQTPASFASVCRAKIDGLNNLHEITQLYCPEVAWYSFFAAFYFPLLLCAKTMLMRRFIMAHMH